MQGGQSLQVGAGLAAGQALSRECSVPLLQRASWGYGAEKGPEREAGPTVGLCTRPSWLLPFQGPSSPKCVIGAYCS